MHARSSFVSCLLAALAASRPGLAEESAYGAPGSNAFEGRLGLTYTRTKAEVRDFELGKSDTVLLELSPRLLHFIVPGFAASLAPLLQLAFDSEGSDDESFTSVRGGLEVGAIYHHALDADRTSFAYAEVFLAGLGGASWASADSTLASVYGGGGFGLLVVVGRARGGTVRVGARVLGAYTSISPEGTSEKVKVEDVVASLSVAFGVF